MGRTERRREGQRTVNKRLKKDDGCIVCKKPLKFYQRKTEIVIANHLNHKAIAPIHWSCREGLKLGSTITAPEKTPQTERIK